MAEELDNELNQPSEVEKRIKDLSGKAKTFAEERDAEKLKREEAETKASEVQRERDFYAGFSDIVADNPEAKSFKDDILTKVKSGYTLEDATFAVLGKAGKLGAPKEETPSPAGGSAPTNPPLGGKKSVQEMTQSERLAALMEAEARGDIAMS